MEGKKRLSKDEDPVLLKKTFFSVFFVAMLGGAPGDIRFSLRVWSLSEH